MRLYDGLISLVCLTHLIYGQTAPPQWDGQKGQKGAVGFKGFQGAPGTDGAKGNKGSVGFKGDPGDAGDQGVDGISGGVGQPGFKGSKGLIGATGSRGDKGDAGIVGLKGSKGARGLKGEPGEEGSSGEVGEEGSKGDKGLRGLQGTTGGKGAKGVNGADGADGLRGTIGSKGDQGFPFTDDNSLYTQGCAEIDGYKGKVCTQHFCEDVITPQTGSPSEIVVGECGCHDGFTDVSGTCIKNTFTGMRDCSVNNGGCEQTCSNGECSCSDGYTLKQQGNCVDKDECSKSDACLFSEVCINLIGSYLCLEDTSSTAEPVRLVGRRLLNESALLAILIWFLLLLMIILALMFYICSRPALRPNYKLEVPPIIEAKPPIVEYVHYQMPGTESIPNYKPVPIANAPPVYQRAIGY